MRIHASEIKEAKEMKTTPDSISGTEKLSITDEYINLPDAEVKQAELRVDLKKWDIKVNKRIAYEVVVPRKFEDVSELLAYGKHFFPLAVEMKYQFAADYPDKIEKDSKDSPQKAIDKTYHTYMPGLEESPGSRYRVRDMVYNNERLHYLVVLDQASVQNVATAYYLLLSYEVNSENPKTSKIHVEAGFSSSKFNELMFANIFLRNLKIPIKRMHRWMIHPEDAARREIIRRSLVESRDIKSKETSQYTVRHKILITAPDMFSLLNQGKRLAEKIIGGKDYNQYEDGFVKDFPIIGEIYLKKQKSADNEILYSSKMPDYSVKSLFKSAALSFSILFRIEKHDEMHTVLALTLMCAPLMVNKEERVRVQLNYALLNSCTTTFCHLVNEINHDKKTRKNLTPEIDVLKVIPEEIKPCLALSP